MPVLATASATSAADRRAASYFTRSRWLSTSADRPSTPGRGLSRRSSSVTSSWQSMPSMRYTDSACTSHTVQAGAGASAARLIWTPRPPRPRPAPAARSGLLDVFQPLFEQARYVVIVERVEHHPTLAPRPDNPHRPQQPELVRDGRFAEPEERREVAHAQLCSRERVENPHPGGIAKDAKRLREFVHLGPGHQSSPHARHFPGVGKKDVTALRLSRWQNI